MMKMNIRKKFIGAVAIAAAFLVGITPITAFAQSDENAEDTEAVETIVEPITEPEPVIIPESEPEEENYGPLTPDGNLTLVDDYGSIEAGGKQFITVVTKKGNYFYIIIDRDDQGNETVHFLNMVDESDLLSLMEDEEAQKYVESISTKDEEPTEVEEVVPEENAEVDNPEKTPNKSSSKTGIMVLILAVTIGGIAGYLYLKKGKKKDAKKSGPDPDADYTDEEEDFFSELPADDFDDETEDDEIIEDYDKEESREE